MRYTLTLLLTCSRGAASVYAPSAEARVFIVARPVVVYAPPAVNVVAGARRYQRPARAYRLPYFLAGYPAWGDGFFGHPRWRFGYRRWGD